MKKLLSLIGTTTLILNSGIGAVLIANTIKNNEDKTKIDGDKEKPDGDKEKPDGDKEKPDGDKEKPDGDKEKPDGDKEKPDGDKDNDIIKKLIEIISKKHDSIIDLVDQLLPYLNNKLFSNDLITNLLETVLKGLKGNSPDIEKQLSYINYIQGISTIANELSSDWYQQSDFADTPFDAMKNFINTEKGDIAQAKNIGTKESWHYVAVRAKKWNWSDFYQYMAGVNMNYMIKVLSGGSYIGDLVNKHLYLGWKVWKWGLDKDAFLKDFSTTIQKIETNKEAWPYLIKAIIPLLKSKLLNQEDPTIGFKNLSWKKTDNQDLSLKTLFTELKFLLSPEGHNELIEIFASLLSGPFGEDIIIDFGAIGIFTFTEILETINLPGIKPVIKLVAGDLSPKVIGGQIVNELTKITDNLNIVNIFDEIINKAEAGISENPVVDLKDLLLDIDKLYANDNFQTGLDQLIDLIVNPNTSDFSLKEILKIWGVQQDSEEFKVDSPLSIIKKWIDEPKSIFNQILNIIRKLEKNKLLI